MSSHLALMRHLNLLWENGVLPLKEDLLDSIKKKQDKQVIGVKNILASDWTTEGGETFCSFEEVYPVDQYDISVEPDGENVTDAQMSAWLLAKPVGSPTKNRIILKGTTPEVDIPVMIKVVNK